MKYFAYGSNLNSQDLSCWCKKKMRKLPELHFLTPAYLDGYELAFTRESDSRKGGVADIRGSHDIVEGGLFEISEKGRDLLRAKEGYPKAYQEIPVEVRLPNGSRIPALTYQVISPSSRHIAPSPAYLQVIIEGAKERGLSESWVDRLKTIPTNKRVGPASFC